jgi:hypothetical protein
VGSDSLWGNSKKISVTVSVSGHFGASIEKKNGANGRSGGGETDKRQIRGSEDGEIRGGL